MMARGALISSAYLAEQRTLHALPQGYGGKGRKWAEAVLWLRQHYGAASILDYGCGRGSLALALRALDTRGACRVDEYDPAIAGKDAPPSFADLVVCTDVLEHVEPERLDAVLTHLRQLARYAVLLVVALDPANKWLTDGRNAHLIQESAEWWAARVQAAGFTFVDLVSKLPLPVAYGDPAKREKRWIAVVTP